MPFPYVRGIFLETLQGLRQQQGWQSWNPKNDVSGGGGAYDSEVAKIVLDNLVVESEVIPYFFTSVADVIREGSKVRGVLVESKEGRGVLLAKQIIDASGDGDVCARAQVPFEQGRAQDGAIQPMTMIFKMDGVDTETAYAALLKDPAFTQAWQAAKARGEVTVPREDVLASPTTRPGQWHLNTSRILGKDGTKVRDVTEAMIEGRRQVAEIARFLQRNIPGFAQAFVSETPAHIGVRETRRILCDYTITASDITEVPSFEDCIARGNWYIDIHGPSGEGTERIHPPEGKWYEIPYRSIRARGVENLLIASRCLDCTHEAHAAIRITPQVMAIGEGAGTAAALCVTQNLRSTRDLCPGLLRDTLRQNGAFV